MIHLFVEDIFGPDDDHLPPSDVAEYDRRVELAEDCAREEYEERGRE